MHAHALTLWLSHQFCSVVQRNLLHIKEGGREGEKEGGREGRREERGREGTREGRREGGKERRKEGGRDVWMEVYEKQKPQKVPLPATARKINSITPPTHPQQVEYS